jgi:hypothetical protein
MRAWRLPTSGAPSVTAGLLKMGLGDQLIATGLARDAWSKRRAKVAFGANGQLIWDKHSEQVFQNNPNILFPGNDRRGKVEWIAFHKGSRGYNKQGDGRWIWNMDWRCIPGEVHLGVNEKSVGRRYGDGFAVIEPHVVPWKSSAANKRWPLERYQAVADSLRDAGVKVAQFVNPDGGVLLNNVHKLKAKSFRDAISILKHAALYIGSEGGMHHAAAAVSIPGVVLFGGFIPPTVTGYETHTNLVGSDYFCGSFATCPHCADAMAAISVDTVVKAAKERL